MKDSVIRFLRETIIGKTLFTDDIIYKLGEGCMEGVYSDQMMFSDLVETENGFKFNMTTVTHELVYNLDEQGVRTTVVKDYTGTSVFCYELAMRKSTNQLTGYMHCVSTTVNNSTMEAVVRDNLIGENQYKPVAFDSKARFYLDKGKVVFEYLPTLWEINPDTLAKGLSKDNYPPYISKER